MLNTKDTRDLGQMMADQTKNHYMAWYNRFGELCEIDNISRKNLENRIKVLNRLGFEIITHTLMQ